MIYYIINIPPFFLGTAGAVSTYILLYFTKLNPFSVCAKC